MYLIARLTSVRLLDHVIWHLDFNHMHPTHFDLDIYVCMLNFYDQIGRTYMYMYEGGMLINARKCTSISASVPCRKLCTCCLISSTSCPLRGSYDTAPLFSWRERMGLTHVAASITVELCTCRSLRILLQVYNTFI